MTSVTTSQLCLTFEAKLPERFSSLREYISHRVREQAKPAKTIAADMDLSPSMLSRKLNPGDGDTQKFNVDDLEAYLASTGDAAAVIEYLASKYLAGGDEARKARAIDRVERLSAELAQALAILKEPK